jgi:4-amino-4-deoxy-L-arabinose transferase-like glycosyltransferase
MLAPVTGFGRRHKGYSLFLLALAVRIAVVIAMGPNAQPPAWGDDNAYDGIATRLLNEHQYVNTWYPPGYPLFLAIVYATFGKSWLVVRVLQALVGSATCVMVWQLGTRLFSARVGVWSALILAAYPGHAYMSWRLMGETLYSALLVFGVLLAVELLEAPRPLPSALLGLTLGTAQLVKSNLFAFPFLLLAWFAVAARGGRRARVVCLLCMAGAAGLASAVTPVANSLSPGGQAAALPGNAGRTLWFSNNPVADGYWTRGETTPEGRAFIAKNDLAQRLEEANEFEKDRLYRRLALLWIQQNPGQFVSLCLKKLSNAFGLFPRALSLEDSRVGQLAQALSYGLVAPFALVGLLAATSRLRACAPLYLVLVSYLIMVLVFYGTPRFTLVVMPFLIVFAAYAAVSLLDRASRSALRT